MTNSNQLKQSAKAAAIAASVLAGSTTLASAHSVDACMWDVIEFCGSDQACRQSGFKDVRGMVISILATPLPQRQTPPSAMIRDGSSTKVVSSRSWGGDRPHSAQHRNAMTTHS